MSNTHHTENHSEHHQHLNYAEGALPSENHVEGTKAIWRTFWLLFAITLLDIALYFMMDIGMIRNVVFIILGVVKAYFIVGIFMHMKYEKLNLAMMIVGPAAFIVYLVIWMLYEGNFWGTI